MLWVYSTDCYPFWFLFVCWLLKKHKLSNVSSLKICLMYLYQWQILYNRNCKQLFRTSFCEIVPYPRIVRFTHCDFFKIRRTTASYLAKSNPPGNSSLLAKYEIALPTIPNSSRIIDHFSGEILNYQDS